MPIQWGGVRIPHMGEMPKAPAEAAEPSGRTVIDRDVCHGTGKATGPTPLDPSLVRAKRERRRFAPPRPSAARRVKGHGSLATKGTVWIARRWGAIHGSVTACLSA